MMSLFKWSTPERRKGDGTLSIIPNEIYLSIFEYMVPPTGRLSPEQITTLTRLSGVCRLFANLFLPRIFELIDFSGSIFCDDASARFHNNTTYKPSREATLCYQIAAEQPLALSLAKCVRVCRFMNWEYDKPGSWALRLFVKKYLDGISHMTNIRELKFYLCAVDAEHWQAIVSLNSLEDLYFQSCDFLQDPADLEPENRVKVRVPCLDVTRCKNYRQLIAVIDPASLRTLRADFEFVDQIDWLSQSAVTELHCCDLPEPEDIHIILTRVPQHLETLSLSISSIPVRIFQELIMTIIDHPAWSDLSLLRSLTLQVDTFAMDSPAITNMLSSFLGITDILPSLQSLTLDDVRKVKISSEEIQHILFDNIDPASGLTYFKLEERGFCLVDGEWTRAS